MTDPQLSAVVADIRHDQLGTGLRAYLHNPAIQQAVFNVALFVPLGMFLRHLFRRGPVVTIAIWPRDHRGLSGVVAGLRVVDVRVGVDRTDRSAALPARTRG